MIDAERALAFPGGNLESFSGRWPEMMAIASAAGVRNSMEDHHAGVRAEPNAVVTWPGGECLYHEAAKISDYRLRSFNLAVNRKLADDLYHAGTSPTGWRQQTSRNFEHSLNFAHNWYLPKEDPTVTRDLAGALRSVLPEGALRKDARSAGALHSAIGRHPAYIQPLMASTIGEQGPARAYDRGLQVTINTKHGPAPWANVSHMSDKQMKAFNIGMSDYVLSAYGAMEEVAFERPARKLQHER